MLLPNYLKWFVTEYPQAQQSKKLDMGKAVSRFKKLEMKFPYKLIAELMKTISVENGFRCMRD